MTKSQIVDEKIIILKSMYNFIGQDEDAYMEWIQSYSDEPSEYELTQIAKDDTEWENACARFGEIVDTYHLKNPTN